MVLPCFLLFYLVDSNPVNGSEGSGRGGLDLSAGLQGGVCSAAIGYKHGCAAGIAFDNTVASQSVSTSIVIGRIYI